MESILWKLKREKRREKRGIKMNELDVIESLKQKEEELDNLLKEAGETALQIKEGALRKAKEIRLSMSKEIDRIVDEYTKGAIEKIDKEAETIKTEAMRKAEDLKQVAEAGQEKTVDLVVSYLLEAGRSKV